MLSRVWLFATPWAIGSQAPLSMGFTRQEQQIGLPFPSPEEFVIIQWTNKSDFTVRSQWITLCKNFFEIRAYKVINLHKKGENEGLVFILVEINTYMLLKVWHRWKEKTPLRFLRIWAYFLGNTNVWLK